MYLYLNLPLLCLLHSKAVVVGQLMYHSYHTYDHYSHSEENDYSHSTTERVFEYHDFVTEPQNMTEYGERVKEYADGYHQLESVLENLDRGQFTLDEPYHIRHSSIGFNAHLDHPFTAARVLVLLMDHLQYPNKSKTEYPLSKPHLNVLDIGSGTGYMTTILAHMVGHEGYVIGLEHVPELVKLAHMALEYDHYHFLQSERVKFILKDGRKGHAEEGPYDIIHVGAACLEVPEEVFPDCVFTPSPDSHPAETRG
uniref:protein-L-isoaspartate(D-aspartate) O-methyltransferase n=1 Tax=Cacopsylla melanoneura TaxID=428564 RepID=A0A8D8VD66_9HEMI